LKLLGEPACVAGLLGLAGVFGVGPEQVAAGVGQHCGGPAQAVPVGARDDVDVQVRDALGDGVIDADEAAVRARGGCHGRAELPYPGEQRPGQFRWQVGQRRVVQAGDDQHVPFEHRADIEECHGVLVRGHDGLIGFFPCGDRAENAIAHAATITSPARDPKPRRRTPSPAALRPGT
jgi:hypothetical protein